LRPSTDPRDEESIRAAVAAVCGRSPMRRRVPGFGRWLTEGGELPYGSLAVIERWAADDYRKLQRRAWRSARVTPEDCRLAAEPGRPSGTTCWPGPSFPRLDRQRPPVARPSSCARAERW
jgi:hypothetical protein